MKKTLVFCLFLCFYCNALAGQELVRTKNQYTYNNKTLSTKELKTLYKKHPLALKHFKKANRKFAFSSGCILLGGVYLGNRLGYLSATGDLDGKGIGFGTAGVLIGILISSGTEDQYNKAVTLFNQKKNPQLKITPSKKGVGVVFNF